MTGAVRGDPDLLEAYSQDALPQVEALQDLAAEYAVAVASFNAALPNDLGTSIPGRSAALDSTLEALHRLDRLPAAFAEALRTLDRFAAALEGWPDWFGQAGTRDERLLALTAARLDQPAATDAQLMARAADLLHRGAIWPWRDGVNPWLVEGPRSRAWWGESVFGLGTAMLESAARPTQQRGLVVPVRGHWNGANWVADHHRWRPGTARYLRPVTSANTLARWGPRAGRVGSGASLVFAGVGQAVQDWDDPTLSTGDRVARVGMTTMTEGAGSAVGAYAGALIGQTLIPIPVLGAVVGGFVGGWVGGQIGELANDNAVGLTTALGDTLDDGMDLGRDLLDDIGGPLR